MLTILLAASVMCPTIDAPSPSVTIKDFEALLSESGYTVVKRYSNSLFDIKRKGYDGEGQLFLSPVDKLRDARSDSPIDKITFRTDLVVAKDLDVIPEFKLALASKDNVDTTLLQHINRTISSTSTIQDVSSLTKADLIKTFNFTWEGIDRYAKKLHGKFERTHYQVHKIDGKVDNRLFTIADDWSLMALIQYWGWYPTYSHGGSSHGWFLATSFGSYHGSVQQSMPPSDQPSSRFDIHIQLEKVPPTKWKWLSENQARYPWAKFDYWEDRSTVNCMGEVTLTRSTKVADVKKQIQTFIDQVKNLEKDLQ